MPLTINQERILRRHKFGEPPPPATEVAKYHALARHVAKYFQLEAQGKGTTRVKQNILLLLDDLKIKSDE